MALLIALPLVAITSASERGWREQNDVVRGQVISAHNAQPGIPWRAGYNERWAGQPLGAAQALCGVTGNAEERLARMRARVADGSARLQPKVPDAARHLPKSFDAATHWPRCSRVISDIRDQSDCGCCWAFGAAEAASDRLCIATNGSGALPLSANELCFCANDDGCDGGDPADAWHYISKFGLATGGQVNQTGPFGGRGLCSSFSLPHCHHHGPKHHGGDPYPSEGTKGCPLPKASPQCPSRCDAGSKAPYSDFRGYRFKFNGYVQTYDNDADTIALAILQGGPLEASFDVYDDFENYVSGIYVVNSTRTLGGHAVRIVGWGEDEASGLKFWRVANSWNPYWGENGYFRIRRGTDEAGIEATVISNALELTSWEGPGLSPPPPPEPPTPPEGDCSDQETRSKCARTWSEQQPCKWCELRASEVGYCTAWTEGCLR
jgi:cathepsin B